MFNYNLIETCIFASYIVYKDIDWIYKVQNLKYGFNSFDKLDINIWLFLLNNKDQINFKLKNYEIINRPNICHFETDDNIIISFSGTRSIIDIIECFKINLKYNNDLKCKIHNGFFKLFNSIKNEIEDLCLYYNKISNKQIIFTGHSLGGVIAKLCALNMNKNFGKSYKCITFGCPLIGNITFTNIFNKYVLENMSIICQGDFYTKIPLHYSSKENNTYTYDDNYKLIKYNDLKTKKKWNYRNHKLKYYYLKHCRPYIK